MLAILRCRGWEGKQHRESQGSLICSISGGEPSAGVCQDVNTAPWAVAIGNGQRGSGRLPWQRRRQQRAPASADSEACLGTGTLDSAPPPCQKCPPAAISQRKPPRTAACVWLPGGLAAGSSASFQLQLQPAYGCSAIQRLARPPVRT